ncbi:MAG TPA: Rrf2 family transcriptional regulator [Treponemataceae bacterium]|nr:Rrf2 family transcriptional regulator [Treponemataceae bacterium]
MKISTRGRYGVRLLIDLAEHPKEDRVALAVIAERQRISVRYLEQVAVILRRAGFIRSVKGASGGFALALPPTEIIIGDALRTLEGDVLVADPAPAGIRESPYRECVRSMVYDRLNERIAGLVDRMTLASLVERASSLDRASSGDTAGEDGEDGETPPTGTSARTDESFMYFI